MPQQEHTMTMRLNLATADPIGHAVDTGVKLYNAIEGSRQKDIENARQAAQDQRQIKADQRQEEEWKIRKEEAELRTSELKKKILNDENTSELNFITLALQDGIPFRSLPPEKQEKGWKLIAELYHAIPGAPSSSEEIGQRRATWDYMSKIGNSFEAEQQPQPANGPLANPAAPRQGMNPVQQTVNGAMGGVGGKQLQPPVKITDPTLVTPLNGTVDPSRLAGEYKDEKGTYYTRGVSSAVFDPNRNAFTVMLKAVRPGAGTDGSDEVFEVPVTEGRTNTPNDPIKWITVDKLKQQAAGHQQLFALGDYTEFNQLPAEEQLKYFAAARAKFDPQTGREEIKTRGTEARTLALSEKKRKLVTDVMASLPADAGVSAVTRALLGKGVEPKEAGDIATALTKEPREPKSEWRGVTGKPNMEQLYRDGKRVPENEGGVRPRWQPHAPRDTSRESQTNQQDRRDIITRLHAAQRAHQDAIKTGDPDTINEAVSQIESLNDTARTYGVSPLPLPSRPFSSSEEEQIKAQAIQNLNTQRSGVAKFFGTKPNVIAINQEIRRIKQKIKPGNVSFNAQTPHPATQQRPATGAMQTLPPANQHHGRIARDTVTGKRYQSVNGQWQEVR